MKLIIDVADNKVAGFMELIKGHSYVTTERLSTPAVELLAEVREIKEAFKDLDKVKAGKLKIRPVAELLNEL